LTVLLDGKKICENAVVKLEQTLKIYLRSIASYKVEPPNLKTCKFVYFELNTHVSMLVLIHSVSSLLRICHELQSDGIFNDKNAVLLIFLNKRRIKNKFGGIYLVIFYSQFVQVFQRVPKV
jgi:hypothetical protein